MKDELTNEFYQGISTRYDHILANLDVDRPEKTGEIARKFEEARIVVIHGALRSRQKPLLPIATSTSISRVSTLAGQAHRKSTARTEYCNSALRSGRRNRYSSRAIYVDVNASRSRLARPPLKQLLPTEIFACWSLFVKRIFKGDVQFAVRPIIRGVRSTRTLPCIGTTTSFSTVSYLRGSLAQIRR